MNWYAKLMDGIVTIIEYIMSATLAIMAFVTVLEVVRRYIFGLSYPWAEELVRYLLVWVTFVGGSVAFKTGNMVLLDLVINYLSDKNKNILAMITNTVSLAFLAYLFHYSVRYTFSSVIIDQISTGLGVSMLYAYLSVPLGFGLMIVFSINNYSVLINNLKKAGQAT